ncbi:MAG TPA: hypothetical protein VII51_10280 [Gaiellaceae bacterium]
MKKVAFAAALVVAIVVAAPAGAHRTVTDQQAVAPGTWCGGTLWKLMTLSDSSKGAVNWTPVQTGIADIAKLTAPTRILASRSGMFEKKMWRVTAVIERYRIQSNGEIALEMNDVHTSTYMNAYMPNPKCLSSNTRGRADILAARTAFTKACGAPAGTWKTLGATVTLTGVGFWNPAKTTLGALANGAELRPVTGFKPLQGCGHF